MNNPSEQCLACDRIIQIKNSSNPYFVAELETGYVVIGDYQFFKGYTVFICKKHIAELHQLEENFRYKFLQEMSEVAEAVFKAFKPRNLNYEIQGNSFPHLHWLLFPRYGDDPMPNSPIWTVDEKLRCSEKSKPSDEELEDLKKKLFIQLQKNGKTKKF